MEEEVGEWSYLIVDPNGIRPRDDAIYCKDAKSKDKDSRFKEGTCIEINKRRKAGWTYWLGLASGEGWVFDVSPHDKKVRMVEVENHQGEWLYETCADKVAVIERPSLLLTQKLSKETKAFLEAREVVTCIQRIRAVGSKGSCLKLADGRGWVFDFSEGKQTLRRHVARESSDGSTVCRFSEDTGTPMMPFSPTVSLGGLTQVLGPPEFGRWDYVVLDPKGMSVRSDATYERSEKNGSRIEEGEIVTVLERRSGDGNTFLRLERPQGWAFDRQPGPASKGKVRMTEVQVELGLWYYRVTAERGVGLRSRCSFAHNCKTVRGPDKGALVKITQRATIGETTFLQVKEGGWLVPGNDQATSQCGWIFDIKAGKRMCEGPVPMEDSPPDTTATIRNEVGVFLACSPTSQDWAQTTYLIFDGDRVHVHSYCEVENVKWARVSKLCGKVGWVQAFWLGFETQAPAADRGLRNSARESDLQVASVGLGSDARPW